MFADPTCFDSATVMLRVVVGRLEVSSVWWWGSFFLAQVAQLVFLLPVVLELLQVWVCRL